jgi:putative ABC transport system permease protein
VSIIGLSIGLAIFILGFLYLNHEWRYDKGFSDYENIYRIETVYSDGHVSLFSPQLVSDIYQKSCPEIESLTKFLEISITQPLLKINEEKSIYINHLYYADSSFFKTFDFPFVYANSSNCLSKPKAIVLSKEAANKLFNNINPVGKSVTINEEKNFIVTGVFDNTLFPSHLSMDAVTLLEPTFGTGPNFSMNNSTYTYVKINRNSKIQELEKKLTSIYRKTISNQSNTKNGLSGLLKNSIVLEPLKQIYLHSHTSQEISKSGNETGIWLITCLIVFMLIVSAINFTNLTVALAPAKAKEIAVRKLLGSSTFDIIKQLYFEIFIKCLISLIFALVLVALVLPTFSNFVSTPLSLFSNNSYNIWLQIIELLIFLIIAAGTYPVLYISFIKTPGILKGNFLHSRKGNTIRNILLAIQFIITSIFISGVIIISNQVQFLRNKDLGFNPDQILLIHQGQLQTQYNYDYIKERLMHIPGVKNISYTSAVGNPHEQVTMHLTVNGKEYSPKYVCVDTGYFTIMAAHIISGRNFTETYSDTSNAIIINRTLSELSGINYVKRLNDIKVFGKPAHVIGIVDDLNFYGFENKIEPTVFITKRRTLTPFLLVKLNSFRSGEIVQSIQKEWKSIEPGFPLRYQFLDHSFEKLYESYEKLNKIFAFFTICALLVALTGIFSLTAVITMQRSKEIAMRRVLGATTTNILKLVNINFIRLTIIANIIAFPLARLLSQKWLDNFAYRINVSMSPFLVAFALSLILSIITVCMQSFKIILQKPVESLRQE